MVTALAARIPGARLRLFEGGHLFMLEDKNAYPAMVDFLSL
jgi:3-oxoadipate enol-lactonase